MTRAVTQQTRDICATFRKASEAGEDQSSVVGHLASLYDVQRPAIWKALRRGGVVPPYAPRADGGKGRPQGGGRPGYTAKRRLKSAQHRATRDYESTPRVDRDPCQRCGVRHDVGCNHSRAPLGMVL
jgi:hypothetical protein